jgi:DNA-binding MarR family transcriptional regulator
MADRKPERTIRQASVASAGRHDPAGAPADPDLALLLAGAGRVVADRLGAAVAAAGVADMRTPYGFVIRALAERPRTLTQVATALDVSKQAAIKVVDEMERRGFLRREPDPVDRRAKLLRLTDKGLAVRAAALAESRRMEAELRDAAGSADAAALRRALLVLLERHEGPGRAGAGTARALW